MHSQVRPYPVPWLLALWLALLAALPASVRADAREYFLRGQNAYEKSNYQLAIEQWEKAYELEQKPRIQYNLSLAYERLGMLEKAIAALKLFLGSADPDDPAFADASASLAALEKRLADTGIRITGGPEGARVLIDGREWGRLPRPDPIPVEPGSHDVVIRHHGHRDFVSNVVVPGGQVVEVPVRMISEERETAGEAFFDDEEQSRQGASPEIDSGRKKPEFFTDASSVDQPSESGNPTVWYITSGGLAAGAVGAAVWTAERASQLSDCDQSDVYYCKNEEKVRGERNLAALTTVLLGAGAIGALVYGLTIDAGDSAEKEDDDENQEQQRALSCGPTLVGARCALQF